MTTMTVARGLAGVALAALVCASAVGAQQPTAPTAPRRARPVVKMDSARAAQLYVSDRFEDLPPGDIARQRADKAITDSLYAAHAKGVMEFRKVTYRSTADGLEIPAMLFAPLQKRGARGHAALVWVHGGVHGNFDEEYLPFVKEAVQKGYVVIAPDYRGSTGYTAAFYNAIDYGGREVDDAGSAHAYLSTLPYVDPARIGVMGWSHGGMITSLLVFRKQTPFKAAAAIVPVTNLVFRLGYKGPSYARSFAAESTIKGLPFEKPEEYIKRSPLYHVDDLGVPLLVHVATNDTDVNYVEDQQLVDALRARKPELAETKVYVDPPPGSHGGGHSFSRRVNATTHERDDSPEQRDSWNRVWTFFDWWLRPYNDATGKTASVR